MHHMIVQGGDERMINARCHYYYYKKVAGHVLSEQVQHKTDL